MRQRDERVLRRLEPSVTFERRTCANFVHQSKVLYLAELSHARSSWEILLICYIAKQKNQGSAMVQQLVSGLEHPTNIQYCYRNATETTIWAVATQNARKWHDRSNGVS